MHINSVNLSQNSCIREGVAQGSNPLPFKYHFSWKRYPVSYTFYWQTVLLSHIPCLELCSFNNQNWEMHCFVTAFYDPWNGISGWVKCCHTLCLGGERIGRGVRENNAYCFLLRRLTCLEFELLYNPDSKMVLIFLVTKVFQNGTMFRRVYV